MKFQCENPEPVQVRHTLEVGKLVLNITPQRDGTTWQHFILSQGQFSSTALDECCESWPKEVVTLLRSAADQLETLILEDQEHETSVEGRSVSRRAAQA